MSAHGAPIRRIYVTLSHLEEVSDYNYIIMRSVFDIKSQS